MEAPDFCQRARGNVEGSACFFVQPDRLLQEIEQTTLDNNRFEGCGPIQSGDLTVIAIDRQLILQSVYQLERFERRFRRVGMLARIEKYLKLASHGHPPDLQ